MKKTIYVFLFIALLTESTIAQICDIPVTIIGIKGTGTLDRVDCGNEIIYLELGGYSLNSISATLHIKNIRTGTTSSLSHSGTDSTINFNTTNTSLYEVYWVNNNTGCSADVIKIILDECNENYEDKDNDGYSSGVDSNDNDPNSIPLGPEFCDGYDNNSNGLIDDADPKITGQPTWALDEDNDGAYLEGSEIKACYLPDENYIKVFGSKGPDCDDTDPDIHPDTIWSKDIDGDGYAFPLTIRSCTSPGVEYSINVLPPTDCDDTDPNINPSVTFECGDGKDNDCDYQIDEEEDLVYYLADKDNDGYGNQNDLITCNPPAGYIAIHVNNPNTKFDCNDNNPNINPGKVEIPFNGIDDDCNPETADNSDSFSIPDPNFEQALIDLEIDTDGIQNNQVLVIDLEAITHLNLSFPETNPNLPNVNAKINDLSGIQLFTNLVELNISGNNISDLRGLTGSNISNKSTNAKEQLMSNQNTIEVLNCSFNNLISLDVSNMSALKSLNCSNNQLENLNVKNGINTSFILFNATSNANLNCINVDNTAYSKDNWTNIDAQTSFNEDCSSTLAIDTPEYLADKIQVYPNPVSETLNIVAGNSINIKKITLFNILGQQFNQPLKSKINVNNYHQGLYLLKIETNKGNITKKILIQN